MNARWLVAGAGVLLAALALWHPLPGPAPVTVTEQAATSAPFPAARHARPASDAIVVYVTGAVERRGIYRLRSGSRVADAIAAAGGLVSGADDESVNLAARLADGDEVLVPVLGQTAPPSRLRRARRHASPSPPPAAVDVNVASPQELARVPGIGRALAQRIVEMRESDGAFAGLDELLDVAGMTQARLERARPFLQPPSPTGSSTRLPP